MDIEKEIREILDKFVPRGMEEDGTMTKGSFISVSDFPELIKELSQISIQSKGKVIAEGKVNFNDKKAEWQIGDDLVSCLLRTRYLFDNRDKQAKLILQINK